MEPWLVIRMCVPGLCLLGGFKKIWCKRAFQVDLGEAQAEVLPVWWQMIQGSQPFDMISNGNYPC